MSDLTEFRDYCRTMGARVTQRNIHLTAEERALFRQLANEVDAYLTRSEDAALAAALAVDPPLFEETP